MCFPFTNPTLTAAIKFAFQNLGASLGGIINLALNLGRNYRGSVSSETYIVLMTIMSSIRLIRVPSLGGAALRWT